MKNSEFLSPDHYLVTYRVDPKQGGWRLDRFICAQVKYRSREKVKQSIENGSIRIERMQGPHLSVGRLKPSTPLLAGDSVLILSEKKSEPEVNFRYKVLFEDEALLVIDKPANLPVHPAGRYFFNTLLTQLRNEGRNVYLPHRIDKETSGVLVTTKTPETCTDLVNQFSERLPQKKYIAIAQGVAPERFTVDVPLSRSDISLIELKMMPTTLAAGGQPALTHFQRKEVRGAYSLLECFPKTGRQHQIRVHLEHAGHPIVGDKLYGRDEKKSLPYYERRKIDAWIEEDLLLPRHALHADSIQFEHPLTREKIEFHAELPEDLDRFFKSQGISSL